MNDTNYSTRVRAPASSPATGVHAHSLRASMTSGAQSPLRDGSRPMLDTQAGSITRPKPVNLRHCMRIATWNVLSLSHPGYVTAVTREMDRYKVKLAGLTEARIPGSDNRRVENFTMLHSGNTGRTAGVALLLHRSIQHSLVSWTPISDRLLQARLTHQHGKLTVIVAYAPTEDSDDDVKDIFYNQLQSALLSTPPHDHLVVLGDLNAVSGTTRQGFENAVGPYGSGLANDNSLRLMFRRLGEMCERGENQN